MVSFVRRINYLLLSFPSQRLLSTIKKDWKTSWSLTHPSISFHHQRDLFHLTMTSSSSLSMLNSYYDTIVEDLISTYPLQNIYLQKILSHFKTVLSYNISDGKKLRGTTVIDTVRAISSNDEFLLKQAAILGWCIELMQGSFLVADDLMDHSLTRRGKPCWYLNIKEKESAVNDAFYLYSCTFTLLNKYFPTNFKLYHLFNETFQRTVIGQGLDLETPSYFPSIDLYTEEHYYTVVTWKTAYYTIVLPIFCGLLISPLSSLVDHPELKSIGISIGIYFQVQDDYLDCYGDINQTGKIGTDIQEQKCSWLIVQAMKLLKTNEEKREILRQNYGFDDPTKIQSVKNIYHELNLKQIYQEYEQKTYEDISQRIHQANFDSKELVNLLKQILDSIHARSK